MKRIILTLLTIVTLTSLNAQTKWHVDEAHSSITFSVSHFMISEVTGNFRQFSIDAVANQKFEKPTLNVSIDATSINTNQEDRDNHLKSPDFFNVEKNPNITFKSTRYKQLEDGAFEISGQITINGITKDVAFNGKLNGVIKDDRSGKHIAGLKLKTVIKREDFKVGLGMSPVGKDVIVVVNLEMNEE